MGGPYDPSPDPAQKLCHAVDLIIVAAMGKLHKFRPQIGDPRSRGRDKNLPGLDNHRLGRCTGDLVAVRPDEIDAWSKVELQNADRGNYLRGLIALGLAVPESAVVWPEPALGGE